MRTAGVMQWTVRLEATTSEGEVTTTELVTFSRPVMVSTLAEIGLVLSETKALLAKLQASMLCSQVAAYAAHHRGIKSRYRPMCGFKCPRSAARFCRAYDELRNFLRPRDRHHQHVPADRCKLLFIQRTTTVLAILDAA